MLAPSWLNTNCTKKYAANATIRPITAFVIAACASFAFPGSPWLEIYLKPARVI
jgi:hypothetical protein